jgi:23S rRNA (cytidine1920-2'-O)/16S rRNA (cytidine1409-2'-O)-methyltransferase
VVPPVLELMKNESHIIALIKPQFEAGRNLVGKGGIIRDQEVIKNVISDISAFFIALSLKVSGVIPSPVKGTKGNQEYLIHARKEAL